MIYLENAQEVILTALVLVLTSRLAFGGGSTDVSDVLHTCYAPSDYSHRAPDSLGIAGWSLYLSCNIHAVSFSHLTLPSGGYNVDNLGAGWT